MEYRARKRNPGFPSWSWTGWAGPLRLSFPLADAELAIPEMRPKTNFWVEKHDGHLVEFHASRDHHGKLLPVSSFLHVEGLAVKLQFKFGKLSGRSEAFPHQQDIYGPPCPPPFQRTANLDLRSARHEIKR